MSKKIQGDIQDNSVYCLSIGPFLRKEKVSTEEYPEVQPEEKNSMKEPWLAVFLSTLWPGAGQMYRGEKSRGIFFVITWLAILFLTALSVYEFLATEDAGTARFLLIVAAASAVIVLLFGMYALFDAYAIARDYNARHGVSAASTVARKPWLAVFLSYLLPGIGHLYAKQTVRGTILLVAALVVFAAESEWLVFSLASVLLSFFAMKDAFDSAGDMNGSSVRFLKQGTPLLLLVVVMTALHSFPFEELVKTRLMQAYKIPTGSMLPTLNVGDFLLVDKSEKAKGAVSRGSVVVFKYPVNPEKKFIKRVIGMKGDKVQVITGDLYVNEQAVSALPGDSPGVKGPEHEYPKAAFYEERLGNVQYRIQRLIDRADQSLMNEGPWVVPEGSLFVLGDNRDNSQDSRQWGPVPKEYIEGKALKIFWSWDSTAGRVRWDRIGRTIR